jgi:hypothetical protein
MDGSRIVNSEMSDKMAGMDFCEMFIRALGKQISSITWFKEDENGHHHFNVTWLVEESAN